MRKLLFTLHLYGALIMGLFIVILGVSGAIIAFEEDFDKVLNPTLFKVEAKGPRLPVAQLESMLSARFEGLKFTMMRTPTPPDEAYTTQAKGTTYFLNPYTGEVVGTRTGQTTLSKIHQLHLRLLLGKTGEAIVAAAAIVLVFLIATGIYLWLPFKRLRIKFDASLRRVSFDTHLATGIYSAFFLALLTLSGLFIAFDDAIVKQLYKMTDTRAPVKNTPSTVQDGKPISPDQAMEAAGAALPGAAVLFINNPPNKRASYLVAMRYPEDLTPGGRSWVNIDQYSGKAVFVQSSRTAAGATKSVILNRAIHTGDIFGYPSKIIVALSSLLLSLQALTGYYMWWKRIRVKEKAPSQEAVPAAAV